ncbi:hypothetical protein [Blastococcus sp. LR1]|uniref:hypothetical protein n=1 Tax=Blastococcus sp. LR1 TaxID=2877000 RepID=UPI001CC90671|nr:hypothetical protein [Blastococcus sp. LR1]MCA0146757.1 hypothetical protein [Blastococcus sp. LR1]
MAGDLSLFGDEPGEEPDQPVRSETSIADWLVSDIRAALNARGLTTMATRQHAIEAAVGRPVASLRSLTRAEAMRVLSLLVSPETPQRSQSSAWDDRDEDTWIDRL